MRPARTTGVALATVAMVAASASAKTITLHYFAKQVSVKVMNRAGHPRNPDKRLVAGDVGDLIGLAYVGDHNHHAKRWSASFHARCVARSSKRANCDIQIAIGGSMLLGYGIHLNHRGSFSTIKISSGTGVFQRAHGTVTVIDVANTNSSDFTIRVSL
jgi:hypothetical protein